MNCFKSGIDRCQLMLLPASVDDYVSGNNLARGY